MNKLLTIALMFKVLDQATAPVRKINDTVGATGKELEKAAGKSGQLKGGIDRIGAAAVAAAGKLDSLNKKTEKFAAAAEKLDALGKPLAAGGVVTSLGIEKTLVNFANLEEAQKGLRTTLMDTAGRVGPEFEKLNSLAEKLGTDLPGSTKDMLEMFIALREQGVQTNRILGGTGEAAANFAALMKLSFPAAATHVAKFSESMGVADGDMVRFMDLLQRLKYASGVEVGDLAYTFKYAGGSLKLLGLQGLDAARDFSAVVGVLAAAGIEGSTAGTNIAQALGRMAEIGHRLDRKQIKKLVGPILDKYGIKLDFFTSNGEFKGLRPMIAEMEKLKSLNPQEQIITLKKLFGDEAARPLAVLLKSGVAGYDQMLGRIKQQADMQTKIREIMSGTKMQWETMTGTAQNLSAHIGGVFARLINLPGILGRINDLFGRMDSFALLHPKTAGIIAGIVLGITGLSLAGGALLITMAGLGSAWPRALEGLSTIGKGAAWATGRITALQLAMRRKLVFSKLPDSMFGDVIPGRAAASVSWLSRLRGAFMVAAGGVRAFSLALFTTPVGWIALAIGAAALLIYKFWGPISGFFRGMWKGMKEGLVSLGPAWDIFKKIAPLFMPIILPLKLIYTLVKALMKPVDDTGKKAENMGVRFGKAIGGILSAVLSLPAKMLVAGANIVDSLFQGMMKKMNKPAELMRSIAQRVRNFLPFSPAKEGPLRDIHRIKLVETIAESIKPRPLVNAMRTTTAAAMLAVSPVSGLAHAAASGGMNITFAPQITVKGGDPAQIQGAVNQALNISFAEFERLMQRYESQKQRRSF
ncbi:MAG: phage tail tape measure protein [Geobacteraceae bacterium]|nr:phage tail tape measure protein [Geobacteraceae bacterium]